MVRRACLVVAVVIVVLGSFPGAALAQRYAYLVRDCSTGCVGQQLLVFDAALGTAITQVQLAVRANGQPLAVSGTKHLAISPEGRRAYVTFDQRIVVVDLTNDTVLGQFAGVQSSSDPVVSPDGQRLYVLNRTGGGSTNEVLVFGTVTGAVIATHALPGIAAVSELTIAADESSAVMRSSTGIAELAFDTGVVRTLAVAGVSDVVLHPDGARAFTLDQGGGLAEVDLGTMTVTRTGSVQAQFGPLVSLAISPDGSRLYAGAAGNTLTSGSAYVVDSASLSSTGQLYGGTLLRMSPGGLQIAAIGNGTGTSFVQVVGLLSTSGQGTVSLGSYDRSRVRITDLAVGPDLSCSIDPPTPASATVPYSGGTGEIAVPAPAGCAWTAASSQAFVTITSGQGGHSTGVVRYAVAPNPQAAARSAAIAVAGHVVTLTQGADPDALSTSPASLRFRAHRVHSSAPYAITPAQQVTVFATGPSAAWTVSADQPWIEISGASQSGGAQLTVGIVESLMHDLTGTRTATVTIDAPGHTATVPVTLVIDSALGYSANPFGQVDTPAQDAAGVQGAISMSGWALDDVGVTTVKIYRNCLPSEIGQPGCYSPGGLRGLRNVIELGDATFVAGARPDVEAAYPAYPAAARAGWGFMILSNMLPDVPAGAPQGGVGPVELHALAISDYPGVTRLGRTVLDQSGTRVTLANDSIAKPFGAIDTPTQGQTVGGTLHNFGWALTPDPGTGVLVPTDGSTITVFVDGAPIGTVTYDLCRGTVGNPVPAGVSCDDDVSTIFRGDGTRFRNLDAARGPIGLRSIDTATLTNGLHTLSWSVTDSAGRSEGIGSRYFTVINGSGDARPKVGHTVRSTAHAAAAAPASSMPPAGIYARTGFDLSSAFTSLATDAEGVAHVRVPELGRVELRVPGVTGGVLLVDGRAQRLPVGVGIDAARGLVTWAPGVAYLGTYRLLFGVRGGDRPAVRVDVTVAGGAGVDEPVRMRLDAPAPGVTAERRLRVEGWALDPQARAGAGISAVHVWATSRSGGPARFLGAAHIGLVRPDVAAAHGARFTRAGFRLLATLPPGTWDVTAYVRVRRTGRFDDARSVAVSVK